MKKTNLSLVSALALALGSGAALAATPATTVPATTTPAAASEHKPIFSPVKEYTVGTLPERGEVKLKGTISGLDGKEAFTLKDASGSIKVELRHGDTTALKEGAEIEVVGSVEGTAANRYVIAAHLVAEGAKPATSVK